MMEYQIGTLFSNGAGGKKGIWSVFVTFYKFELASKRTNKINTKNILLRFIQIFAYCCNLYVLTALNLFTVPLMGGGNRLESLCDQT